MPQPQKSRRVDQCCYAEGRRRCRRSATGNPPLCGAHKIAVAEQVRSEAGGYGAVGAGVSELFDRILSGRRVSKKVVEEAIGDVASFWEQYRQQPSADPSAPPPPPPRWWDPIVKQRARAPADPRIAELKAARARARVTLGLEQQSKPTRDELAKLRKDLGRRHHPDRGGSTVKMQEINAAVDVLLAELVT